MQLAAAEVSGSVPRPDARAAATYALTLEDEVPEGKHLFNVDRRGNCGASGAPTVMSENWDNPALGDAVALCVVGSGLTWAGTLLQRNLDFKRG